MAKTRSRTPARLVLLVNSFEDILTSLMDYQATVQTMETSCRLDVVSNRLAYFGREAVASPRRSRLNCVRASQATEHATPLQFVSLHCHKAFRFSESSLPAAVAKFRTFCFPPQLPSTTLIARQRSHISSHGAETGHSWVCQVFSDYSRVRRHLQIVWRLCGKAKVLIQKVLRKSQRHRSKAAIEIIFLDEAEERKEEHGRYRRTSQGRITIDRRGCRNERQRKCRRQYSSQR